MNNRTSLERKISILLFCDISRISWKIFSVWLMKRNDDDICNRLMKPPSKEERKRNDENHVFLAWFNQFPLLGPASQNRHSKRTNFLPSFFERSSVWTVTVESRHWMAMNARLGQFSEESANRLSVLVLIWFSDDINLVFMEYWVMGVVVILTYSKSHIFRKSSSPFDLNFGGKSWIFKLDFLSFIYGLSNFNQGNR